MLKHKNISAIQDHLTVSSHQEVLPQVIVQKQ